MHLHGLVPVALVFVLHANAFDFPGAAPHNYAAGEAVDLFVNALTPKSRNAAKFSSSYNYYDPNFHFCEPTNGVQQQSWSLNSIFNGRTFNSPYDIKMLADNSTCKTLCTVWNVSGEDAKFINGRIKEGYALNWLIDGLPAAEMRVYLRHGTLFYDKGFPLGIFDESRGIVALNNHYEIVLSYRKPTRDNYHIISVLVWPRSISGNFAGCGNYNSSPMILSEDGLNTIKYTYRVTWNESDIAWASRWDSYLYTTPWSVPNFNLVKSLVVTAFLCVMVFVVLLRTIPRDISSYNTIEANNDAREDRGWKVIHGEVFRTPSHPAALAIVVGSGAHLCAVAGTMLAFMSIGFPVPSDWKLFCIVTMTYWSSLGGIGGYCSSGVYTSLKGPSHRKNALLMVFAEPMFVFVITCSYNFFHFVTDSYGALPFIMIQFIFTLWLPLSVIGAFVGMRHGNTYHLVPFNQIPRQVPRLATYLQPLPAALIGGIFPFATASVELPFLLSTLSTSHPLYGFLILKAGAVALTTITTTVLFTYFILCAEEYRWHWRAFLTGGGSAFWVLGYGLYYWVSYLSSDSYSSIILYLWYLFLIVLLDFLVTGTIGFLASYWVLRKLYSTIRLD